jgi:hypothetical protein
MRLRSRVVDLQEYEGERIRLHERASSTQADSVGLIAGADPSLHSCFSSGLTSGLGEQE